MTEIETKQIQLTPADNQDQDEPVNQIGPDDRYFISLDKDGQPQRTDMTTGETVPVNENALTEDNRQKNQLEITDAKHLVYGKVWVPRSTTASDIKQITGEQKPVNYSPQMGEIIVSEIINGRTIRSITKDPRFPSYITFLRWRREVPSFGKAVDHAKTHRAEAFFDLAIDTVTNLPKNSDSDSIKLAKLKSDVYKYAAKIGDQSVFGDKSHVTGDIQVGHYMIETGIRRPGDPGFKIDETKKLVEKENAKNASLVIEQKDSSSLNTILTKPSAELNLDPIRSSTETVQPLGSLDVNGFEIESSQSEEFLFGEVPAIPEEASLEDDL